MSKESGESTLVRTVHERPAYDLQHVSSIAVHRVIIWMFLAVPGGVLYMLAFGDLYSVFWTTVVSVVSLTMFGVGVFGCGASIVAYYSIRGATIYTERSYFPKSVPGGPVRLTRPDGNQLKLGRYEFAPSELDKLATTLHQNGWRFVRDVVRESGVFKGIGKKKVWDEVRGEFDRLGFIGPGNVVPHELRHELCVASPALLAQL